MSVIGEGVVSIYPLGVQNSVGSWLVVGNNRSTWAGGPTIKSVTILDLVGPCGESKVPCSYGVAGVSLR